MDFFVSKNTQIESVTIPASKSYAQRAILAAVLCDGETEVKNVGESKDVNHFITIGKQLGASIVREGNDLKIIGGQGKVSDYLNAGESGLGIRLAVTAAAVLKGEMELTGEGSLLKRPMTDFEDFLPQLGINCATTDGYLPIRLSGKAVPGTIELDGSLSSQYLSGLLMALPKLNGDSELIVHNLNSIPYIDITLEVLETFGIKIAHTNYKNFSIPGNQDYDARGFYLVEGDYSGASMWMVKGALKGGITIKGLNPNSVQGDRKMLNALKMAGVSYHWDKSQLIIEESPISPFDFNATNCPDLFPALVVLAAGAHGETRLHGVERLYHKESNRALVLQKEFAKLDVQIELKRDFMIIHGTGQVNSGEIHSNNDHRIAMAGAIAAFISDNGVKIQQAESVEKSYPNFWREFQNQ